MTGGGNQVEQWEQPIGGHNAYNKGDKVLFEGQVYESLIDENTWSPSGSEMGRIYTQRGGVKTGINNYALDTMLLGASVVTNGTATNKDGANATIEQLKSKAFYRDTMSWDMENIWTIDEGNDFPKLKRLIRR